MGSKAFSLLIAGIVVIAGFWLWKEIAKPLPGQTMADMGREHITDISSIAYNTNPPTSGSHFPVWAKKGVYDRAISDGYLLHSLEHGYVVISYNCDRKVSQVPQVPRVSQEVYAHEEPVATESADATSSARLLMHMQSPPAGGTSWFTPENPPAKEVELSESFNSEGCKDLVSKLSEMTKVAERVIVVPRPQNDSLIALTAWGRIEKLDKFDKEKIEGFVKAWNNKGPEKTVE